MTTRAPAETIAAIEAWAVANLVTRSEAVRRLVEIGLTKSSPSDRVRAARADELAGRQVADPVAPADGRAQRRRRLTKGPSEFREVRVDVPKAKKGK